MCGNGPSIHKGVSNWGHWLVRSWLELGGRLKSLAEYLYLRHMTEGAHSLAPQAGLCSSGVPSRAADALLAPSAGGAGVEDV